MLLLCCADAGLQPPAAGFRNACDPYSSWAGSMVPLLHINANATTWKELFAIPLPPNHRNKTRHSVFSSLLVLYQFIICLRIYTDANMFIWWAKDGRAQTELCMTWAGQHLTRQENDGDRTRWTLNTQTALLYVCAQCPITFSCSSFNGRNQNNSDNVGMTSAWLWDGTDRKLIWQNKINTSLVFMGKGMSELQ